jgi:major outer membrane protein
MKTLCILICTLLVNVIYALPVGNPSEASLFQDSDICHEPCAWDFLSFGVGFYGNYVFNRHLETVNGKEIDATKLFTNSGCLVVNLCKRVDLFSTLGVSRLSLNTSLGAFNSVDPHPLFEIESGSAFSYSVGARATILSYRCVCLGIEGEYFSFRPHIKRMYIAAGAVSYPDEVLKTHYQEWQVGTGVSYQYNDFFAPYVAVKYSQCSWRLTDGDRFIIESNTNTFLYNLKNHRHFGYAVGLTFCPSLCEKLSVSAEARFCDEKALYINGQMRF